MRLTQITTLAIVAALSTSAFAQERSIYIGAGGYFPTGKRVKDLIGDSVRFDFDFGGPISNQIWKISPDLHFVSGSKNGNKFTVVPFGVSAVKSFGSQGGHSTYVKFLAGGAYTDYSLNEGTTHYSGKKFGAGGSAEVGSYLTEKVKLSVRYDAFSKVDNFDFSGLTAQLQFAIGKF
jgi:hypothetical protein